MPVGTLTLDRFNGREQFAISEAWIVLVQEKECTAVRFDFETDATPLQTLPDTESLCAHPNGDFIVRVKSFSWEHFVGFKVKLPSSYDEAHEDYVTRFYYCEHQEVEGVSLDVLESRAGRYLVAITGTCVDVNYYDGSKPRTIVRVDAWFAPATEPRPRA